MQSLTDRLNASLEGRYRILRELGAGGMATVFLAEDLRHDRKVALKVLKPELAAVLGAERFVVEIKTTAALQHPHILPLFDSGEADGFLFYVMPFIDGETLRDKLNRESQFGVDEALRIACDIADALDYAHRHAVIHRDIKPENILLHDGRPMVADFGIALALSAAAGGRMTETGLSLGTPHYMSPEQATAEKEITGRSDIYSLASVLYEMLSGEPPHMGKTAQQIIMKIIAEPVKPVTELRKSVPPHVAEAVAQALEKLPADRFSTAAEFAAALQGRGTVRTTVQTGLPKRAVDTRWRAVALVSVAAAVVLGAFAAWNLIRRPEQALLRLGMAFPEKERIVAVSTRRMEFSRDGQRIVYIGPDSGGTQLWVREMDELSGRPLPGTHNGTAPFFSPDGASVGFITESGSALAVVSLAGGLPRIVVSDSVLAWGADWGDDGFIYLVHRHGVVGRVRASGGGIERLTQLDSAGGEFEHDWPQVLPGSKQLLVQVWRSSIANSDVAIVDIASGQRTTIARQAYGRYLPSGHVIYATIDGLLRVVAVDASAGKLIGEPMVIAQNVEFDSPSGAAQFAVSETGRLLFSPGGGAEGDQAVWVDRKGAAAPVDSAWRGQFGSIALAPDNGRLSVAVNGVDGANLWIKQLPRGPLTRMTRDVGNYREVWFPNGRELAFIRQGLPRNAVFRQRADGSAPAEPLVDDPRGIDEIIVTNSWLVYRIGTGTFGSRDIFARRRSGDTTAIAIAASPSYDEYGATVTADERWVAYVSVESGRPEVYVRSLTDPSSGRLQVSIDGGEEPLWSHSGRELFYRTRRGDMIAAERAPGAEMAFTRRSVLFTNPAFSADGFHRMYDLSRDDSRFVMIERALGGAAEAVLISDWRIVERRAQRSAGTR
ncbi:MAG: protein kinase [Gemmatimonadaceae bacterium]|nr:protein kinase [Gemmatimonadaceae bacterium]